MSIFNYINSTSAFNTYTMLRSFKCPITHQIMRDAVLCSDDRNYERAAIMARFAAGNYRSPVDNSLMNPNRVIHNVHLQNLINLFLLNGAHNDLSDEVRRAAVSATNARILARHAAIAARRAARRHSNE